MNRHISLRDIYFVYYGLGTKQFTVYVYCLHSADSSFLTSRAFDCAFVRLFFFSSFSFWMPNTNVTVYTNWLTVANWFELRAKFRFQIDDDQCEKSTESARELDVINEQNNVMSATNSLRKIDNDIKKQQLHWTGLDINFDEIWFFVCFEFSMIDFHCQSHSQFRWILFSLFVTLKFTLFPKFYHTNFPFYWILTLVSFFSESESRTLCNWLMTPPTVVFSFSSKIVQILRQLTKLLSFCVLLQSNRIIVALINFSPPYTVNQPSAICSICFTYGHKFSKLLSAGFG